MTKAQKIAFIQKQTGAKYASTQSLFSYHESVLNVMINTIQKGQKCKK